jgi:alkaline phosphatase
MKRQYIIFLIALLGLCPAALIAQNVLIHSHNDYEQRVPFYQAYSQQVASIEADIYAVEKDEALLVAHAPFELMNAPTLDEAYINPLVSLFKRNGGKPWKDSDKPLILLIDLKTPANPTLDRLIDRLKRYPEVFDPAVNANAVRVIISGDRPNPNDYAKYPSIISFDGNKLDYTPQQLEKISMISLNLRDFTKWNGKGSIIAQENTKLQETIDAVHALGKPIRFWGTPDGVTAWYTFYRMGIDYINTDQPEACAAFFRNFQKKTYRIAGNLNTDTDIARAKRLDKATADFQGFSNKDLHLSKGIEVYKPSFRNDGQNKKIKNVIFLIGDGMGLAQVCAADAVNNGLSILQLKYLGFQKTNANDVYTTDSAAAGSGLATGKKNNNRHIAMSPTGEIYPSMTDVFYDNGYACGVVTLGDLADATPAAYYGHSTERDDSDEITRYLLDGKLTLLNGSGMKELTQRKDGIDLISELKSKNYTIQTSVDDINQTKGKVICVDERMGRGAREENLTLLADATRESIQKLSSENNKGFFLMVEGAKIDYAGHANSLPGSIVETLSFDLAVAEALKFADSNGETLIIITGDHETGGLTLVDGNKEQGIVVAQYMTDDHTPIMLPVYSYGPGANKFTGVYENTQFFHTIKEIVKLK